MRLENGITRNLLLAITGWGVSFPGWRMGSVVFQQIRECIHLSGLTALLWGLDKPLPMAFFSQIKMLGTQPCLVTYVWSMTVYMAKLSNCNRDHMACKAQIAFHLTFYRRKFVNPSLLQKSASETLMRLRIALEDSDSVGLQICIFNKLSSDDSPDGPWTILGVATFQKFIGFMGMVLIGGRMLVVQSVGFKSLFLAFVTLSSL